MTILKYHVISNTHWDREWRYPFQAYRMDLVEMMDRLVEILETCPDYRAFFLDSQTVILEDYLEIRPKQEKRIQALVKADRLQIGPWYTLPDQWCCPGEALVRNLLMGHRSAKRFGPVTKAGYTPFSNGQISQLPQLYQGFGIDSCFFYRGVGKHVARSEFLWEGADGTRVFGFKFGDYARYNYYYLVYRPGLLGRLPKDREYAWENEEIAYRVANEQSQDRQYAWMNQRLSVCEENLPQALADARRFTEPDATTSQLLYMMGHDHSYAAREELALIEAAQKHLRPEEEQLFHSALNDYLEAFRQEAQDLQVLQGEMRHTNKEGLWTNLMALILSCRLYLKQQNARVNAKILQGAEPLAAFAWLTGSEYPAPFLEIAWKKLLINQAHDAVGGCSVDRVHEEMQARWGEVDTLSDEICRRSMRDLAMRIRSGLDNPLSRQLTLFNTLPFNRDGVVELEIDLPLEFEGQGFAIQTSNGEQIPIQIVSSEKYTATVESGYELPLTFPVERYRTLLFLSDLPAFGYEVLEVIPGNAFLEKGESLVQGDRQLENEYLKVHVNDNGTLELTDKRTGRLFSGLGLFEDTAEFGDPWNRVTPPGDRPILSSDAHARCSIVRDGALEGTLRVAVPFRVPVEKFSNERRSDERVDLSIVLEVTLKKQSPVVELTVHLENQAKDHRLRILFSSGIQEAEWSYAEGQFDVLQRPIQLPPAEGWKEPPYPTHPMWNFVDVSDGQNGFAVINDGLTEYEVMDNEARTLAITLLRAFGKFVFERPTPGSQCLGHHVYRFALYPHTGLWSDSEVFALTARHTTPVQALYSAPTRGHLPGRMSFFSLSDDTLVFSGMKQSEDEKSLVLRFWNPTNETQKVILTSALPIAAAHELSLEEKRRKRLRVSDSSKVWMTVGRKGIFTLGLRLGEISQ